MNVKITGVNLIISLKTKAIIRSKFINKLDQLLPQFNDELKTATLNIQKDKKYKNYTAKFDMSLPGQKNPIFAQSCHHELTSVIVDLREAVEKQIKKYKHAD